MQNGIHVLFVLLDAIFFIWSGFLFANAQQHKNCVLFVKESDQVGLHVQKFSLCFGGKVLRDSYQGIVVAETLWQLFLR